MINNDTNYIVGVIIAIYVTYVLHNNIKFNLPSVVRGIYLVLITYVAHINIILATILSIGFVVTN
jgi:hypothetical protein